MEAAHRLSGLAGHRPIAGGVLESGDGPDEPELVGERHLAEVARVIVPSISDRLIDPPSLDTFRWPN
jgi:hypothetical protein